ncbi:hypothetical protein [Micromonospora sediminicola]|uniref:hypothetical protein n=1 Tax=Micromonospora sediminicola TaxID=946078 RepID=UPI0037B42363
MSSWRWRDRAATVALVPAVALVALLGLLVQADGLDTPAELVALLVVLAAAGALYARRRYPVAVGAAALVAVSAYGVLLHRPGPVMLVFRRRVVHGRRRGAPRRRGGARPGLGRLLRRRRRLDPDRCRGERRDAAARRVAGGGDRRGDP